MRTIIISIFALVGLGLTAQHFSSALEKSQAKGSHRHGHWSAPPEEARKPNPVPPDQDSIERGKKLYQTHCVVCHGSAGKGDGPAAAGLIPRPTNLVKMAGHHSDGDFAWKIANGRGAMPGWMKVLSERDIWDLTNFIQSFGEHPPSIE